MTCDFQQCGILTSVTQTCLWSLLLSLETPNDVQSAYAQADLRLCWLHIPHCWKSHVAAHIFTYYKLYAHLIRTSSGRVAQSVTCLTTDACLTAYPGAACLIPVRSNTFVEIDHEIISMVILLSPADSFKKGCCQLQAKVCAQITW